MRNKNKKPNGYRLLAVFLVFFVLLGCLGDTMRVHGAVTPQAEQISVKIQQEYASPGTTLTAIVLNAPAGAAYKLNWQVNGKDVAIGSAYTTTNQDLEKMVTVTASAVADSSKSYKDSMYVSRLPVVYVNTERNQPIVSKDTYLNADMKIQGNGQYNTSTTKLYDGKVEIRGRGNSTWAAPKKPYKVKLDSKTDLFGFGANKHWVLLANYTDESHMRNMLAYNLSGTMGMPYMQSVWVELILNGNYAGTYQLCEQIRPSKDRVDIEDWESVAGDAAKAIYKKEKDNGMTVDSRDDLETYMAEKDMTWISSGKVTFNGKTYTLADYGLSMPSDNGGYLMELDEYFDEVSKFTSIKGQPMMMNSPEFLNTNQKAMTYLKDYIDAFETAIDAPDFTSTFQGNKLTYSQLFDMDDLVKFWVVNELFMNVDAMKKSSYLYKGVDDLFHMGPIWDMDYSSDSLVSRGEGSGSYLEWQTIRFSMNAQKNQWYKSLLKDPYFAVKAYEAYHAARAEIGKMVAPEGYIATYKTLLQESADANANIWYGGDSNRSFDNQVSVLNTFLNNRIPWLDSNFATPQTLLKEFGSYSSAGGIELDDVVTDENSKAQITAPVTNKSVSQVSFLLNGKILDTVAVTDNKAVISVLDEKLLDESMGLNTIQVFGRNDKGEVISVNKKPVTDYKVFTHKIIPELLGTVTISGKPQVGETLTAQVAGANNQSELLYTWYANGTKLQNTNQNTYLLTKKEVNQIITVAVTSSTERGTLTSAATAKVTEPTPTPPPTPTPTPPPTPAPKPETVPVGSVTLSKKACTVAVGKTVKLSAKVLPANATNKTVTYKTGNKKIATVSPSGTVKGVGQGKTVITVTAGGKKYTCSVTVARVTLNVKSATMQVKQKTALLKIASKYPSNDRLVSWKSSNKKIADVSKSGVVTAKTAGKAVITVTMKSGATARYNLTVTKKEVKTTKLSVSKKAVKIKKGKTETIKTVRSPITATAKITYTSANKKIATVSSSGKIKGIKKGKTQITVISGGKKVKITVAVN